MAFVHVMLEVYCGYDYRKEKKDCKLKFCEKGVNNPGYHCFENECPFVSYTECPNEIAYVGENSQVNDEESLISFGGEMESDSFNENERKRLISKWKCICKKKISEAYDEYMKLKEDSK